MITQGLVIDEPWISMVLRGEKSWEMRSRVTKKRGPIALIKKGSGLIVGLAEISCSGETLCLTNWESHFTKHRIPLSMAEQTGFRWFVPWTLENVECFKDPMPYSHPSGAVTWVNLGETTISQIIAASSKCRESRDEDAPKIEKRSHYPRAVKLRQFKR